VRKFKLLKKGGQSREIKRNYFKEKRRGVGEKKGCPEEKSFVRKKNSWGQKIILLPEKLTPVPGKKSQVSGEKSPGSENLLFHRQKNGPHSKKMDLQQKKFSWCR
jgi:hypothetical protein